MTELWVPILTHYRNGGVDTARVAAQMTAIRPDAPKILLAGSTGDGWDLDDEAFDRLLHVLDDRTAFTPEVTVMVGALRASTRDVLARMASIGRYLDGAGIAARFAGITVCPPVDPQLDQDGILAHFDAVLEASPWPVSVYQLPQVTGCAIAPATLERLAGHPKVVSFKDSSGEDRVALSGASFGEVVLLRGAEGRYADHLKPAGRYDGWLLSSGNAFAAPLREVLGRHAAGDQAGAQALSDRLTRGIETLFASAAEIPFSNAFSNANRAADHIRAHGAGWRECPAPLTIGGQPLPEELLEVAESVVAEMTGLPVEGYLG